MNKQTTAVYTAASLITCIITVIVLLLFGKSLLLSGILICTAAAGSTAGATVFCSRILKKNKETLPVQALNSSTAEIRPAPVQTVSLHSDETNTSAVSADIMNDLQAAAARSSFFTPLINELSDSISKNLSSTTEPMSEQLLAIRRTISSFLESVTRYEQEVKNHTMLTRMSHESDMLETDLTTLDTNVRDAFNAIKNSFNELMTVTQRIADVANNITEVSDKIRILSFNASIEAARAGKVGSGFRVIAAEIKNLSAKTEEHLSQIWQTLKDTRAIFEIIHLSIEEKSNSIYTVLSTRKQGLQGFFDTTRSYFDDFDHLYTSVNEVIGFLSSSMDAISPVVQLHEITSQEVGNLKLTASDYSSYMTKLLTKTAKIPGFSPKDASYRKAGEETAKDVRRHLTTERELAALERGIKKNIPDLSIDLGINNNAIELF